MVVAVCLQSPISPRRRLDIRQYPCPVHVCSFPSPLSPSRASPDHSLSISLSTLHRVFHLQLPISVLVWLPSELGLDMPPLIFSRVRVCAEKSRRLRPRVCESSLRPHHRTPLSSQRAVLIPCTTAVLSVPSMSITLVLLHRSCHRYTARRAIPEVTTTIVRESSM